MVREFANIQQASSAAAQYILELARSAVIDKGICTIVLAGGSTPQLTYKILSEPANAEQMPWQQCHFFWGDERWVAAAHPASNFAMADKALLSKVPIPLQNIHQIMTGYKSPEIAAEMYEKHLRDFFHAHSLAALKSSADDLPLPKFDLVLLGMGPDGHTASLFPGTKLLEEKRKWVAAVPHGAGTIQVPRITLTLPVLNQADNILFLISGREKREVLNTILRWPEESGKHYPAARISPAGNLVWLVAENP
jgi:6-phosphogluconolactonase